MLVLWSCPGDICLPQARANNIPTHGVSCLPLAWPCLAPPHSQVYTGVILVPWEMPSLPRAWSAAERPQGSAELAPAGPGASLLAPVSAHQGSAGLAFDGPEQGP